MGRIRSIKPETPQSESFGRLSRDARLLFILLWTACDDHGRCRGTPRLLASLLFPYDADAPDKIDGWLSEVANEDMIRPYTVGSDSFIQITNWSKHQRIDNAGKSHIPVPPTDLQQMKQSSPRTAANLGESPRTAAGLEGIGREWTKEGTKEQKAPRAARRPVVERPDGVDVEPWEAWLAVRKRKRAPLTPLVWAAIEREAGKAGMSLNAVVTKMAERGWQSFDAAWVATGPPRNGQPHRRVFQETPVDFPAINDQFDDKP